MSKQISHLLFLFVVLSIATPVAAQSTPGKVDVSLTERLSSPTTATALSLTDEQKAAIASSITTRDEAVAAAAEADKAKVQADADKQLFDLLTVEQKKKFAGLFEAPRLKFNFRLQKWPEVLNWIAGEADLSLVMDKAPPGTFNYTDTKEYTPTEAVDLLNGWLLTKGFTLVRRERLLMCISLTDGLPEGAIPQITPEDLATRGQFEFVSVLIPLEGRPEESVLADIKPLLGTYGQAEALTATGQILVSGSAGKIRLIEKIVKQVALPAKPKPAPAPPEKSIVVVYPIQHANPTQPGEVLNQIISGAVVVDTEANQITINATPTEQAKAKLIIDQLESNQGPEKQSVLELYSVRSANTAELLTTIQLVAPSGQFRYDAQSKKLVAWASKTDQQRIEDSLLKLAARSQDGGPAQLEVYPLEKIDPAAVQTLVQLLLPEVKVTLDTKTSSLIVIGTLEDHQAILTLIDQLKPQVENQREPELRTYPVSPSVAATITTVLGSVVPEATITVDSENNRLLVIAPPDKQEFVVSTIQQLQENLTSTQKQLKIYDARGVDTTSITALLQTLAPQTQVTLNAANEQFLVIASDTDHEVVENVLKQVTEGADPMDAELKSYPLQAKVEITTITTLLTGLVPKALVTPDAMNRRLLITATAKDHAIISQVIAQVSQDTGGAMPELRFYPLDKAAGPAAVTILQAMFPASQISFEEAARRLSVVAEKTDHLAIAETLKKLEQSAPVQEQSALQIYDVNTAQRLRFTSLLTALTTELPGMQVLTDSQPGEMTIWAKPSQHEIVAEIITQLQKEVPPDQKAKLIVYPIRHVGPTSVAETLSELFLDAKITADEKSSRLLIHAKPKLHETIRSAIEQLDTDLPVEKEIKLMVYPIKGIDPTAALQLITSELPEAVVIQDTTAQSLIVRAKIKEHEEIVELLDALQVASSATSKRTIVVYPMVSETYNSYLTSFWVSAFPKANIVVDPISKTMMVLASQDDHESIRSTVGEMSLVAKTENAATLKSYVIGNSDRTGLLNILTQAVPKAKVVFSGENLLAWSSTEDHLLIKSITDGLNGFDGVEKTVAVFDLELVPSATAQSVLVDVAPGVQFLVGSQGKTLIARVDEETKLRVQNTLEQLSQSPASEQKKTLKFYEIDSIGGPETRTVLTATVPEVSFTATSDGKRLIAIVSEDEHQKIEATLEQISEEKPFDEKRKLVIYSIRDLGSSATSVLSRSVPDASINAGAKADQIFVVATDKEHVELNKVLDQLKANKDVPKAKTLAVYKIIGTEPATVLGILQPLMDRDVQLTVDTTGRQIFVRANADMQLKAKSVIEQVLLGLKPGNNLDTKTYFIGSPNADEAQEVLLALYPDATIVTDSDRKLIVATATPEQHIMIEKIAKQIEGSNLDEDAAYPVVYKTNHVQVDDLEDVLSNLYTSRFDRIKVAVNQQTGRLIVVARKKQHETIKNLITQYDNEVIQQVPLELEVYRVAPLEGLTVQTALEPLVSSRVKISAPRRGNDILVSAPPEEQAQIRKLIEQITTAHVTGKGIVAKTYRLVRGEADEAQEALQALFPDATIVTDRGNEVLVATATPEQHKVIENIVRQMTGTFQGENAPSAQTYHLVAADGETVLNVLTDLFIRADEVRLSLDQVNQTLVAIARPDQHKTIQALLAELDPKNLTAEGRTLDLYEFDRADGEMFVDVIQGILRSEDSAAKVVYEPGTRHLVVTTTKSGHMKVRETVERLMKKDPRELEVFQLTFLDPFTAELAIDGIFDDGFTDSDSLPMIQSNDDAQQLIVRASPDQIQEIRALLVKMGEVNLAEFGAGNANRTMRVIRVNGNIDSAIRRVEDLWPKLRKNPIQILKPGEAAKETPGQFSIPPQKPQPPREVVIAQATEREKGNDEQPVDEKKQTLSPIVIMPGQDRLTISSEDTEALDQMEALLRAMFSRAGGSRSRDFSIYQLKNAGATEVSTTLKQIFDNSAGSVSFGRVVLVPDERLNVLIVYAGRSDRERIEQLVEVLDIEQVPDTKRAYQTKVIPLQYADAKRVERLVQGIYKAQMVAGGSRQRATIPKGVPPEVATVLRQINAAASSPLLTVEVQDETNSLIVKAPQSLLEELETLIVSLDESAQTTRSKGVTLLPLRKTNSRQVMKILNNILD